MGLALVLPGAIHAQTFTTGALAGDVRDREGRGLDAAGVFAIDRATNATWRTTASSIGEFRFSVLPPGEYDLFVERLGYRPTRVRSIPVRPGRQLMLTVRLTRAPPPVDEMEVVGYNSRVAGGSEAGIRQSLTTFDLGGSEGRGLLPDLLSLSTLSGPQFAIEGLAGGLGGLRVDGVPQMPARHPDLTSGGLFGIALPLTAFDYAELVTNDPALEVSDGSGASLSAYTRRGTADLRFETYGTWSGDPFALSDFVDSLSESYGEFRGGAVVSGPLLRDTAYFVLGFEGRRVEEPYPRAWEPTASDSLLLAVMRDTFGSSLGTYVQPRLARTDILSGFGRLDWRITGSHTLSVRANLGHNPFADIRPDPERPGSIGSVADGTDFSAAAILTSQITSSLAQELRLGLEIHSLEDRVGAGTSVEQVARVGLPATTLVEPGVKFGVDPGLPGRFKRTIARANETLYVQSGRHRFGFGIDASFSAYDDTYAYGRPGEFAFGGVDEFARREGAFVQAVGSLPIAKYSLSRYALHFQDTWTPIPGLDLTVAARYNHEELPADEVALNREWLQLTGLSNAGFPSSRSRWSPRVGFAWDVGPQHRWIVRAAAGVYDGIIDPAVWGEVLTTDGRLQVRRGVGTLGDWIGLPDSASAPVVGSRLALLGPEFEAPRTIRTSLGVTHFLGRETAILLSGAYRRTDFLPRRADLNLLPVPTTQDQYGRPIYGTLVQQGGLLAAEPGSNRRFSDFDVVSALNPDGESEYWGVTVGLERTSTAWTLFGRYTYSRTEDNWLSGRRGGPEAELPPFPQGLAGRDWARARSDFDIPHQAVIGAELNLPIFVGVRLAALYGFRSGTPFTPGFRDGVDANGDGSSLNDPAFVDDSVAGVADLFAEWDCVRSQVGQFAERNSCRTPAVHSLDLWLAVGLFRLGRYSADLTLDALNLIEPDRGAVDRALYLVDRTRSIGTDPATGGLEVPLVVNPGFGEFLTRDHPARTLRVGLRMRY